jgi:hypothetical protein
MPKVGRESRSKAEQVCRKCAVRFDPLYANSSFLATLEYCFRAGLVVRK